MKKKIIYVIACVMLVCVLAGCASEQDTTTINNDGSGEMIFTVSWSKALQEKYNVKMERICSNPNVVEVKHGNETYYSCTQSFKFTNINEIYNSLHQGGDAGSLYESYGVAFEMMECDLNRATTSGSNLKWEFKGMIDSPHDALESLRSDGDRLCSMGWEEKGARYKELKPFLDSITQDVTFVFPNSDFKVNVDNRAKKYIKTDGNKVNIHLVVKDLPADQYAITNDNKGIDLGGTNFTITANLGKVESHVAEKVKATRSYTSGQFTDVAENAWYAKYLKAAYESGLMNGTSDTTFSPNSPLTYSQVLTICARLHSIYNGDNFDFSRSGEDAWYTPYAEYCYNTGMVIPYHADYESLMDRHLEGYTENCNRELMIKCIASALPMTEFKQLRNAPAKFSDLDRDYGYCSLETARFMYGSGVITGTGKTTISPEASVTRAQAAAIIARVINPSLRVSK